MKILITAALIGASISVSAQNFIGIKGGYSITNVRLNSSIDEPKNTPNFTVGLSFDHNIKKGISVGAELLFEKRGFDPSYWYMITKNKTYIDTKFQSSYITLPIKANYQFGKRLCGIIGAGVIPGLLLKSEFRVPAYPGFTDRNFNYKKDTHKFDLAAMAELGVGYNINRNAIVTITGRIQNSVTNAMPSGNEYLASSKLYHNGVTIFLGAKFKI